MRWIWVHGGLDASVAADFLCFTGRRKETLKEAFGLFSDSIIIRSAMFFDGSVSGTTRHFTRTNIRRHNAALATLTRAGITYGE